MAATANAGELGQLLPAEVAGYRPAGDDALVDRDGLFSLIDGGAEVYRALNVRRVIERRYSKPGEPGILVDVFDMGRPADAYGAYHHDMREGQPAGIGVESERSGGNLAFWKGRYYVSLVPLGTGADIRRAVAELGRAIAARIAEVGAPPALVALLPPAGLVASQVHYFHDWLLLARHTLLADDNLLSLGPETEGLLARYRAPGGSDRLAEGPALLLIRYPSEQAAADALVHVRDGLARLAEPRSARWRQRGRLLLGVLDAPDPAWAERLLDAVPKPTGGQP